MSEGAAGLSVRVVLYACNHAHAHAGVAVAVCEGGGNCSDTTLTPANQLLNY